MKKITFLFFMASIIFSCQKSKQIPFEKHGVKFTCPTGWKIEDEEANEEYFSVVMQKDGLTSSGTIIVTCIYDSLDNSKMMYKLQSSFKHNTMYKDLDIKFDSIVTDTFNFMPCIKSSFKFDWWGDIDQGYYSVLHGTHKTVCILFQEAAKHSDNNKNDFIKFERSFSVN